MIAVSDKNVTACEENSFEPYPDKTYFLTLTSGHIPLVLNNVLFTNITPSVLVIMSHKLCASFTTYRRSASHSLINI